MDLESKLSSLKDFVKNGGSGRSSSSSPSSPSYSSVGANGNSSTNGWFGGNWYSKAQEDPILPSLSRGQRIMGFILCILLGIFCFVMAGLVAPFMLLKARKFVVLYTMGSMFTIGSFSLLWGPWNHVKHLCSRERIPFTIAYFGSMTATLYAALFIKSTILTALFAVVQIVALTWYIVSYIPGGTTGMKYLSKFFSSAVTKTVSKTLPV